MIKEPLFHFFVFGLLIFVFFELFPNSDTDQFERHQIVIGDSEIQRLRENWMQTWRQAPNEAQLSSLIEAAVKQEIYYREALALGLDKNDSVVRNRLVQKMKFMHSEQLVKPSNAELQSFLKLNADKYKAEALYSFQQIYLGQYYDFSAAPELLDRLNGGAVNAKDVSEPLSVPLTVVDTSNSLIAREFGVIFADAITSNSQPKSKWFGPVASGFGMHLVNISGVQEGTAASLENEALRQRVANDWLAEQGEAVEQRIFAALKQKYTIKILPPQ